MQKKQEIVKKGVSRYIFCLQILVVKNYAINSHRLNKRRQNIIIREYVKHDKRCTKYSRQSEDL